MRVSVALCFVLLVACGVKAPAADQDTPQLSREALLDPAQCKSCHPQHYREWASSMHAYASRDPVFVAMNQRGQRETEGALGDFCVRCHAPMAVLEGLTQDGLNLASLPDTMQGVTCYFCHNTIDVGEHFNNGLILADDTTMRGGIPDPVESKAHRSAYSPLHDRNRAESSALCGSCHDVVTPNGVHLERTFLEYKDSLFSKHGPGFETCSGCHMPGRKGQVAQGGKSDRIVHEHLFPGVDVALTDFPDREAQRLAVECALALNARIVAILPDGLGGLTVQVETSAGHAQPSGAALDRRLWLELVAYDHEDQVVFESGRIEDGEIEEKLPGEPGYDRQLALFRDWIYDAEGNPVHMFWEAATSPDVPQGYLSLTLPAAVRLNDAHTLEARYQIPRFPSISRITLRLRMRAIGMDVLEDLVASKDLAPELLSEQPTFTLHGAAVEWWASDGMIRSLWPESLTCPDDYRCLLQTDDESCP